MPIRSIPNDLQSKPPARLYYIWTITLSVLCGVNVTSASILITHTSHPLPQTLGPIANTGPGVWVKHAFPAKRNNASRTTKGSIVLKQSGSGSQARVLNQFLDAEHHCLFGDTPATLRGGLCWDLDENQITERHFSSVKEERNQRQSAAHCGDVGYC